MGFPRYTQECLDAAQGKWPASGGFHGETSRKSRPKFIRVFENDVLEKVFARAHPLTPIVWFGPFIAYGLYTGVVRAGLLGAIGLFVAGWLVWTFIEYLLHRFLFHMSAETPEQKFRAFMVHGYHHEFPNDKLRLVAPPLMSWPIAAVVLVLYHYAFGGLMWAVFAGTATGYVAYDWIHYYTHHFKPGNADREVAEELSPPPPLRRARRARPLRRVVAALGLRLRDVRAAQEEAEQRRADGERSELSRWRAVRDAWSGGALCRSEGVA